MSSGNFHQSFRNPKSCCFRKREICLNEFSGHIISTSIDNILDNRYQIVVYSHVQNVGIKSQTLYFAIVNTKMVTYDFSRMY